MSNVQHYILIGNKRYVYTMAPAQKFTTVVCKEAGIKVRVPNEQVPQVLAELSRHIIKAREEGEESSEVLRFRVTPTEKAQIEQRAAKEGYDNISAYLRHVSLQEEDVRN